MIWTACNTSPLDYLTANEVREKEMALDSVRQVLKNMNNPGDPYAIITMYERIQQEEKEVPDTSKIKFMTFLELTLKLNPIGAFKENLNVGWKAVELWNHSFSADEYLNLRFILYGSMAGSYRQLGMVDSSLYVYRLSIMEAVRSGNSLHIAGTKNNLGVFFYKEKQLDSAMYYFREADRLIAASHGNDPLFEYLHGSVRDNIAGIYEDDGNFAEAGDLYHENYEYYRNGQDIFRFINAGISLANTLLELKAPRRAYALLEELKPVIDTARYQGKIDNLIYLYLVYRKYHTSMKEYELAGFYEGKWMEMLDERNSRKEKRYIQTTISLLDFAKREQSRKLEFEQQAKESLKKQKGFQLIITWLIAFGVISGLAYLFIYYRQKSVIVSRGKQLIESQKLLAEQQLIAEKQEKKVIVLELKNKNKDLNQLVLYLKEKQEWAGKLYARLERMETSRGQKRAKELKELKTVIYNQMRTYDEIETLQQHVENLSSAFHEKLIQKFPALSKTEIRMCSYIRLNFSNAQIAQLQNIAPSSVKVSRYRLWKKLMLDSGEDLDAFLMEL
jgi:hypothetical protein